MALSKLWLGPAAVTAALAAGCAPGPRPSPAPPPVTTPPRAVTEPATPPSAATATADRFAFLPGAASYDVRTEASIEMTSGPEAERGHESVTTTAKVDYEVAPATGAARAVALRGQVSALATQASSRVTGGSTLPTTPIRFRGTVDARAARLDVDGPALGCASPDGAAQAAAMAAARETVLRVPTTIAIGARWRDSTSVPSCRGPLGATLTVTSRYEITGIDGATVRVSRETAVAVHGQGIAGGRMVSLNGGGTGTGTLELDATRGRLTRSEGESRTTVTVTLSDGARQFTQQTRTRVTLAR